MNIRHLAILLLTALPCGAEEVVMPVAVVCGKDTVVLFEDTRSPDSHFALGWTIRPHTKDAAPVDWSKYKEEDISGADLDYPCNAEDINAPYELTDGIVDLAGKSFREFPFERPISNHCNHWSIKALWPGKQKVIVILNGRFWTSDLFLASLKPDGSMINLMEKAAPEVGKLIAAKRPLAGNMEVMYDGLEPLVASDGTIRLSFSAWIPKGSFEDFDGTVSLGAGDGTPVRATSDAEVDQPFTGKLGKADQGLNEVYGKLCKSLAPGPRGVLVSEQKEWIETRDADAREFATSKHSFYEEGSSRGEYLKMRNQKALEMTRDRTENLQTQLSALAAQ